VNKRQKNNDLFVNEFPALDWFVNMARANLEKPFLVNGLRVNVRRRAAVQPKGYLRRFLWYLRLNGCACLRQNVHKRPGCPYEGDANQTRQVLAVI
jgi:hypothetical protein